MKQNQTSSSPKHQHLVKQAIVTKDDTQAKHQQDNSFLLDINEKEERSTAPIMSDDVADDLAFLDEIETDLDTRPPAKTAHPSIGQLQKQIFKNKKRVFDRKLDKLSTLRVSGSTIFKGTARQVRRQALMSECVRELA